MVRLVSRGQTFAQQETSDKGEEEKGEEEKGEEERKKGLVTPNRML